MNNADQTRSMETAISAILNKYPDAPKSLLMSLAWLEGGKAELQRIRQDSAPADYAEYDCICQRCGQRDGSMLSRAAPEGGFFQTICNRCTTADDLRMTA